MEGMWNGLALLFIGIEAVICWTLRVLPCIIGGVGERGVFYDLPYGAATDGGMERAWKTGLEEAVLWIAILAILATLAFYVIGKIRPGTVQKEPKARQWLSKFHELHSRGELSDEEFRTIKTTLETQLQDELNDNGEKG